MTYPQKQNVYLSGTKIGGFQHLPPTLTAQYHFLPDGRIRPYVGFGANYTMINAVNLFVPGVGPLDLSRTSLGPAAQGGCDYKIGRRTFVNVDVKKLWLEAGLTSAGTRVGTVHLDPILVGIGYGFRF